MHFHASKKANLALIAVAFLAIQACAKKSASSVAALFPPIVSSFAIRATAGFQTQGFVGPANLGYTYKLVTAPTHGAGTVQAGTGSFTYTPTSGYTGADSFTFTAENGNGVSGAAKISIAVLANTAPTATAGTLTLNQNANATAGTLVGADADANPLTYSVVTAPTHGTIAITGAANGAYTYTPTPGYFGSDSFTFRTSDTVLNSSAATVAITVNALPYTGNISSRFTRASSSEANSADLNLPSTTAFTLSLWVKMAGTPLAGESLYSIVDQTTPRHLRIFWKDATTLRAELLDGGLIPIETTAIVPNHWNHIVFNWNTAVTGNNFRLFVNGALQASTAVTGSIDFDFTAGEHVEVGHYNHANYLDGWIDDVAFWNTALSDAEVLATYDGGHQTDYRTNFSGYSSAASLVYNWWMGDTSVLPTISPAKGNAPLTANGGLGFVADAP